jgi:hypothetical protein
MQRIRSALIVGFLVDAGLALQQGEIIRFLGVPFHGRVPIIGVLLVVLILLLSGLIFVISGGVIPPPVAKKSSEAGRHLPDETGGKLLYE